MNWKQFSLGVICGVIIGFMLFHSVGQRYRIVTHGPSGIFVTRIDTWTGESWMQRYYDNNGARTWYWEPIQTLQK